MEYREFTGKTVEDAVMEAAIKLETTSDKLDYEILEKGSSGFLGIGKTKRMHPEFDHVLPGYQGISNIKKIDSILWSIR